MSQNAEAQWSNLEDVVLVRGKKVSLRIETIAARLAHRSKDACSDRLRQLERERMMTIDLEPDYRPQQQPYWSRKTDDVIFEILARAALGGRPVQEIATYAGQSEAAVFERARFLQTLSQQQLSHLRHLQATLPQKAHTWYNRYRIDCAEEQYARRVARAVYLVTHPTEGNKSDGMRALEQNLQQTANISATRHWHFQQ
jgi:hypothetical protein